ncbi:protein PAXX isoform X2 [Egretta garzetta]|uniref:protein PAXX isoform X2 n=1 Tax=Egretta garzetta TaxID=188379 RepID=UPI00163CABCD|nr:protein PAXX isoform X2 [Egretta garzetta]
MAGRIESLERRLEVVETLAPSCSPEKNAAWSQQLFLPGRQLPGGTSVVLLFVCLLLPRRLLILCSCALKATLSPLGCGCCQPPHWPGDLPSTEGVRAQHGGSRGVWDALCSDPSPRKNRGAGFALPSKRKIPGESLINPGFKSKKAPSGVDFEDS